MKNIKLQIKASLKPKQDKHGEKHTLTSCDNKEKILEAARGKGTHDFLKVAISLTPETFTETMKTT